MASAQKSTNFISGWVGLLAIAVIVVAIVIAAACTDWQFGKKGLDILAIKDKTMVFPLGMTVGGILMAVYGASRASTEKGLGVAYCICAALAGLSLIFFAIVTKDVAKTANILLFGATAAFLGLGIVIGSYINWTNGGIGRIVGGFGVVIFVIFVAVFFTMNWQAIAPFLAIMWYALDVIVYIANGVLESREVAC